MPGANTTPQFRWPTEIDATNNVLRFVEAATPGTNRNATLAQGTFFWRGDGSADDLAVRLKTALDAAGTQVYTVTLADTGLLTVSAAAAFDLRWSNAATTVSDALFGWTNADTGNGTSHTSPLQVGNAWHPEQVYVDDSERVPRYASTMTSLMNGRTRTQRWGSRTVRRILVDVLPPRKVYQAEEVRSQEAFEWFYAWLSQGRRFEFCRDFPVANGNRGTYETYVIDPVEAGWIEVWPATIPHGTIRRYNVEIPMLAYVA